MEKNITIKETFALLKKRCNIENIKKIDELPQMKDCIVSTGILGLDLALGIGGIRKGSIVEIYGRESSGKTTLALQLCKQYQKQNMPVLYIDSERTLTRETIECMGVKTDNFYVLNVENLEQALEVCKISASAFGVIVIDSLAGLVPKAQIDGDVGNSHAGLFPRIMSDTLPVLVPILADSECTLIITNQIREKIGVMFENPERATGGRALKYYASVRLEVRQTEPLKQQGEVIGNRVRAMVIKNKIATPYKGVEYDIMFGKGISAEGDILDRAIESGIISKCGMWYSYNGINLGRGRVDAKNYLIEHPGEYEKIAERVREMCLSA